MNRDKLKRAYVAAFPYADKQYWYLRSFQFLTQLFIMFLLWGLIMGLTDKHVKHGIGNYYNFFSLVFYFFFLSSLGKILRKLAKTGDMDGTILNSIRWIKWTLVILLIILLGLTFYSTDFTIKSSPDKPAGDVAAYHLTHTFPAIFNPNIGFLIITFLAFYVSKVLTVAKKLKEEQALTI